MLIYNGEVYDLLATLTQRTSRVRFLRQVCQLAGSQNCGLQYEQVTGLQKMELTSLADITLAVKIAQQVKQNVSDRFNLEMAELTQRSTLVVRADWGESSAGSPSRICDFVELPSTSILSLQLAGRSTTAKHAEHHRRAALEQYNLVRHALLLSQSGLAFADLDERAQTKLTSHPLGKILLESLVISNPSYSVVSCSVSPSSSSLP